MPETPPSYADDLAMVANDKHELHAETMEEWNGLFTRHGLKLSLDQTEVLHIGHQREELDIELGIRGEETDSTGQFRVGGAVCGDRKTERVQAGSNARRAVEGVMVHGPCLLAWFACVAGHVASGTSDLQVGLFCVAVTGRECREA